MTQKKVTIRIHWNQSIIKIKKDQEIKNKKVLELKDKELNNI